MTDARPFLVFNRLELSGDDFRREPLDVRKATLRPLLVKTAPRLRWNEHIEGDGEASSTPVRWAGGHRVQAQGLALSLRPFARLARKMKNPAA